MKGNSYKKKTTKECIFCDYYNIKCRKNKKCSIYRKYAKSRKSRKWRRTQVAEEISLEN